MEFKKPMGIDPIVGPIIGYVPTPTDQLRFLSQLQAYEDNMNKYWPIDESWDKYDQDQDQDEELSQIKFENLKIQKELVQEAYNKPIKEEVSMILERVK